MTVTHDTSLLRTIASWRAATEAFDRESVGMRPGMAAEQLADRTLRTAHAAIVTAPAATTAEGALEALRLAGEDLRATLCSNVSAAMVRSAVAYLETMISEQHS